MSQQLTTAPELYKPQFDPDTGKYYDKCPYISGQRNRQPFRCPCNGILIAKRPQYFSHIESQTHRKFLENYKQDNKELDDLKTEKNLLLAENTILKRKIENHNSQLEAKTIQIGKFKKALNFLKNEISQFKQEISSLKKDISDSNNVIQTLKQINKDKNIELENIQKKLDDQISENSRLQNMITEIESYDYDSDDFKDCLTE